MKRFLLKLALFCTPFLFFALMIVLVDPFGRFTFWKVVPEASRDAVAPVANNALWKVVSFARHPAPNVTLGGSKMGLLKPSMIEEASGLRYEDISIGGGSADEIENMFWYAVASAEIKRAVIGVNIETFNRRTNRDRVQGALAMNRNPLLYLTNRDVIGASYNLLAATYFSGRLLSAAPQVDKDAFWREQMGYAATRLLFEFDFDEEAFGRLGKIAAYCHERDIEVVFVVFPNHRDVHQRIDQYGLSELWRGFPRRLQAFGPTFDFDSDDGITGPRANFSDPFHFAEPVARQIISEIWAAPGQNQPHRVR